MNRNTRVGISSGILAGAFITLTSFAEWFLFYYHPRPTDSFLIEWLIIPSLFTVLGVGVGALFGGVIGHASIKNPIRSIKKEMLKGTVVCLVLLVFIIAGHLMTGEPIVERIFLVIASLFWVGIFYPCFAKWTR